MTHCFHTSRYYRFLRILKYRYLHRCLYRGQNGSESALTLLATRMGCKILMAIISYQAILPSDQDGTRHQYLHPHPNQLHMRNLPASHLL